MNEVATATAPAIDAQLCPACKKSHAGSDASTLAKLAKNPARLKQLVKGIDAKGLKTRYGPGKWTIRELLCHLRDCELMFGVRWRMILSEEQPTLQAFDQDRWASGAQYGRQDGARALATLEQLRAGNLEMLKLAGKAGLARIGMHADYGAISIGQMARHLAAHDENHLTHVAKARENWLASRKRKAAGK